MRTSASGAALLLLLLACPARAADALPPAPALPSDDEAGPDWRGVYAGVSAGGAWTSGYRLRLNSGPVWTSGDNPGPNPSGPADYAAAASIAASGTGAAGASGGFIGGGQLGYNYQLGGFVGGLEADIQGIAGASSGGAPVLRAAPVTGPNALGHSIAAAFAARSSLDWIGTVRGRVGWLLSPTLLVYGSGGFAYGGAKVSVAGALTQVPDVAGYSIAGPGSLAASGTAVGWTAGGGLDWMFLPGWSARVDYLYYDLGTLRTPVGVASDGLKWVTATGATARFNGSTLRAGVNYHFGFGGALAGL